MKNNKLAIEIDCPVAKLFEFTVNPDNTPLWIDSLVKEETSERPISRGTEYRNQNKKGEWTSYIVTKFEQDKIFELRQKDGGYNVRYTYEVLGNNRSRLTYFEWLDNGDLKDPFPIEFLEKLKNRLTDRNK